MSMDRKGQMDGTRWTLDITVTKQNRIATNVERKYDECRRKLQWNIMELQWMLDKIVMDVGLNYDETKQSYDGHQTKL